MHISNCFGRESNHRAILLITFSIKDYIQTLSILVRGSTKEKLHWIFRFYDISDDGKLTKQVCTLLRYLCAMALLYAY